MSFFVHEKGICESKNVGKGTRIWAFAHVLPGATIGENCNVCDSVFIENDVVVGNRVTIKCGVQLWDGLRVEDDVFIGPNVTFTNDNFHRRQKPQEKVMETMVCKGASIGANATILPGIVIGVNAMVGAGSVVTKSVPQNAVVVGNPAQIVDYVDTIREERGVLNSSPSVESNKHETLPSKVEGVELHRFPLIHDLRGDLSVGEFKRNIPFLPKRYFMIFDIPSQKVRGEHAHYKCEQFLICVKGECKIIADDGSTKEEFTLNSPNLGLYVPPRTWVIHYKHSKDALLLVFASDFYDAKDYIREYRTFLNEKSKVAA